MPISDTPSALDALAQRLMQAWQSRPSLDELGEGYDQATRGLASTPSPLAPIGLAGMVLNPKNIAKIRKSMQAFSQLAERTMPEVDPSLRYAASWAAAKYPKLYKQAAHIGSLPDDFPPTTAGRSSISFKPGTDEIDKRLSNVMLKKGLDPNEAIITMMHELRHLAQNRNPVNTQYYDKFSHRKTDSWLDKIRYTFSREEINARKAERAASSTYQKFLQMLSEQPPQE